MENEHNKERLAREEKARLEKEQLKEQRARYVALVRSVKSDCHKDKSGLLAVKYKLEYIENGGICPEGIGREESINAYKEGIGQYEQGLEKKK